METRPDFDVIVVGVGGMGSATVYELSRRGYDVLGLEQFNVPHTNGSSHGITRLIRKAYYEGPAYVPLLERAFERWRDLQTEFGDQLLYVTGTIDAGPPGSDVVEGALSTCKAHSIPHEVLTGRELAERYPGYALPDGHKVVYQADGGFLHPEKCVTAHVEQAHAHGAEVHGRERVVDWDATDGGVTVETTKGVYSAETLVFTAGPWAPKLVEEVGANVKIEQRVMSWFQPKEPRYYQPSSFPVFIIEADGGRYYGTPVHGVPGVKIGRYRYPAKPVDPDTVTDEVLTDEEAALRSFAESNLPNSAGPTLRLESCLLTNSKDNDYVLDYHPEHENVIIGAGFSGHGFKLSTTIGELLADLAVEGETAYDVDKFRFDRFDD